MDHGLYLLLLYYYYYYISFAIRTVRNIVDNYLNGRSTTNLCAIDLSKAFDKVVVAFLRV